jgi:ferredoxin-type protein NapG
MDAPEKPGSDPRTGRRGFFRALRDWAVEEGQAALEPVVDEMLERMEPALIQLAGPQVIRAPGALEEREFLETCSRCGKCIEACPEDTIVFASESTHPDVAGSPVIVPRRRACYECEPHHCAEACPTGALVPTPRAQMRMGVAKVIAALCFAHQGRVCDTCHAVCPHRGSAIEMRRGLPVVHESSCTGCGLCEYACPAHPAAIRVLSPR